jgi:hypothetical protein
MQAHVKRHQLSTKNRKLLVGGMKGKRLLIATPLLRWYILHGLSVTVVHEVVEFPKQKCFKQFGDKITQARRLGDVDSTMAVRALIQKLIGNSSFGGTILNKEMYTNVKYVNGGRKAQQAVNNPRFKSLAEINEEIFEIEAAHARITINIPIQLGYMILQLAKLKLLEFYYDCLDVYSHRENFELIEVDTDSYYLGMSGGDLQAIVRPDMMQQYLSHIMANCTDDDEQLAKKDLGWFPRQCCAKHAKFDSRTPLLWKLEWSGHQMIALCSKTYVTANDVSGNVKYSLKGGNKKTIDPLPIFERVFRSGDSETTLNRGIRVRDGQLFTYTQEKQAYTYFYCKRRVLDDGNHTTPLDIVVSPISRQELDDLERYMM